MELKYEQNEEGMYEISGVYNSGEEFRTGFVFDSVKRFTWSFRVSQTDAEGHRKFGLIHDICGSEDVDGRILHSGGIFYTSCIFDKIKPYDIDPWSGGAYLLKAYIGEEEFIICDGLPLCSVFKPDFLEIYHSNQERWYRKHGLV